MVTAAVVVFIPVVDAAFNGLTELFDATANNHFDHNGETGITLISDSENSVIENNTFIGNGMSIIVFTSVVNCAASSGVAARAVYS